MRPRVKVDTDTVVQLYVAGDTTSGIARRLNIGRSTVSQRLREAGVPIRPRVWHGRKDVTDELDWMSEVRAARASDGLCCEGFRRGAYAPSIRDERCCIRCAARRREEAGQA